MESRADTASREKKKKKRAQAKQPASGLPFCAGSKSNLFPKLSSFQLGRGVYAADRVPRGGALGAEE